VRCGKVPAEAPFTPTLDRKANAVAHNDEMPWAEVEYGASEAHGFTVEIEGESLVARGECPRCRGRTAWSFRTGMMGGVSSDMKAMTALSARDLATIVCACGYVHKDRPEDADESGCGAFCPVNLKSR
jgi:hypothetical protein